MFSATIQSTYGISDASGLSASRTVTAEHEDRMNVTVPAAKTGALTTRTDATHGVVTETAHSYVVGNVVDLFWATGKRVGVLLSAVTANTYTFGGGTGDDLPASGTSVWTSKPVQVAQPVDRTKTVAIIMSAN